MGILKGGETGDEDGDRALSTLGDNLGMGTTQILGIYWGLSPKKTQTGNGDGVTAPKMFGDGLGTGKPQILGIFGEKSPKNPKLRGGDEGKNLGDFYHTTLNASFLSECLFE